MSENIESKTDFQDSPRGQQERWTVELKAAEDNQKEWTEQAEDAIKAYLGKGGYLNLFHSSTDTVLSVVYGQVPSVDVSRRFNDSQDDDARVAAEMLERLLQTDIEREDDGFQSTLRYSLKDWKIAGLGAAWLRYEVEWEDVPEQPAITRDEQCPMCGGMATECPTCQGTGMVTTELAPAVPAKRRKAEEDVDTDYVHWRDLRWQPSRSWHEVEWVARRAEMTKDALVERFGQEKADLVPLKAKDVAGSDTVSDDIKDVWSRAEVWEIWDKSSKTVYWFSFGMDEVLDSKPDTLGLESFFPCPRPLASNTTTSKWIPKPDYEIARALYEEIDGLAVRIKNLEECAKVRWVYNAEAVDLKRVFDEALEGEGIPVKNWLDFASKGAIEGSMSFVPIEKVAQVIALLSDKLNDKIALLYQVTGLSDIVRGQASASATATEQRIKAGFASTRLQTDQDEVARFASDLQKLRAEIIAKHYDTQTIIECSNIGKTQDAQRAMDAAELIKSDTLMFRIDIKADSIALRDYAALKSERVETVTTLSTLFANSMPIVQAFPPFGEFMLAIGEWLIASTKGSQTLEASFDEFRNKAQQFTAQAMAPKPPPPPDPKVVAEQQKAQASVQTAQIGVQEAGIGLQKEKIGLAKELAKAVQPPPMPGRFPNG